MSSPSDIKLASAKLGIALQQRHRAFCLAIGDDEVAMTTTDLAQCMIENIDFVIWALKKQGGLNVGNPDPLKAISKPKILVN